ncbi:MAG: lipoprotein-releasing system ATP-binding protein LolD [Leptospira sp.]|jgi:ABC-type lipoprotein export system ATPase subunit|nr:MAG: lipoprotein-releasing system ATP-binding protein LolD [Leptospira sp.]
MIRIRNLEKNYRIGSTFVNALKNVSLEVSESQFVTLMGPSGSGKSSLLNILASIDKPDQGSVEVFGFNLNTLTQKELNHYRRSTVGIIFQFFNLLPYLSALENVSLPLYLAGVPTNLAHKRAALCLEMVGLKERILHKPTELSGGEQQRVAIARSIVHNPKLLLADEPTGNLDSDTSHKIMELLLHLRKENGFTLWIVTHNPAIGSLGDLQIHMKDGKMLDES